jgi:SAM-dependent methyltransferase
LFKSARVLHFAPEPCVTRFIRPASLKYTTADLDGHSCDLALNIEKLDLPDEEFDVAICSHVLEHVDDRAALRELYRVLKAGGLLILMVPLVEGWEATYEDEAVKNEADRALYFGQGDHVRFYGADLRRRITEARFDLSEFTATEPYVTKHGLLRGEKVFIARRPNRMN